MWRDGLDPAALDEIERVRGPGETAYRREALERIAAMSPPTGRGARSTCWPWTRRATSRSA